MTKRKAKKAQNIEKAKIITQGDTKSSKNRSPVQDSVNRIRTPLTLTSNFKEWVKKIRSFIVEVRVEFDKITWPSKKEAIAITTAVLAITFFFTAYLGLVDFSLTKLVSFLIY